MLLMSRLIEAGTALPFQPLLIICHGELMSEAQRRAIVRAFGCDVFNQYGAQEVNRIAWDCAWRAREMGWTDCFGFPDQMRAAREYDWRCFKSWQAVDEIPEERFATA